MIYYQNGMLNNVEMAKGSARYLSELMGEEVGIINNMTHGLGKDVREYSSPLGTKDVLTAYEYEKISKTEGRHLVLMHSAGNEDGYKALKILDLEKRNLEGKVDFMSVGSPIGKEELSKAAEKVGGKLIGQYNNWKDPVTHPKTWATGAVGLGLVGVAGTVYGGFVLAPTWVPATYTAVYEGVTGVTGLMGLSGLKLASEPAQTEIGLLAKTFLNFGIKTVNFGVKATGAAAGAAVGTSVTAGPLAAGSISGGGATYYSINKYHSFEKYLNRNEREIGGKTGGLVDTIKDWKERNIKK